MRFPIAVLGLLLLGCATGQAPMSQASLAEHIQDIAGDAEVSGNVVQFEYGGVGMACVSDATHDRMRLITPVAQLATLPSEQLAVLLFANFHTTLDARYAVSDGIARRSSTRCRACRGSSWSRRSVRCRPCRATSGRRTRATS